MPIKSKIDKKNYDDFIKLKKYLSNHTKKIYLVGGAVRDMLLGYPVKDLDIEVYNISEEKFENIMQDFGAIGVGKNFFVYKWKNIDISLPRIEKKIGKGHQAFKVEVTNSEKEASKRRDFTMNALMLDIFSGNMIDFWGGRQDIKRKIIRLVDIETFKDDSLRVLRAVQFASRFGFKCDKKSIKTMQNIDISDLSKERIFWEFEKLFESKNLHIGFYYLVKLKLFEKLFGFKINCTDFFKISKEFLKYQKSFEYKIYKFYFLYIISKLTKKDINTFLDAIGASGEFYKFYKIQKNFKKENIKDRDILEVSLKMPLSLWLENYHNFIKRKALKYQVYDKKLKTDVKSLEVIQDGFSGKEISTEIKNREILYIDKILKNRKEC